MKRTFLRVSIAAVAATLFGASATLAAADEPPDVRVVPDVEVVPDPDAGIDPNRLEDLLTHEPIAEDLANTIETIQRTYGEDDRFGTVALSKDRQRVSVTWYGDVPADIVSDPAVDVVQAAALPGELRRAAQDLAGTEWDGREIVGAGVEVDGSGISVDIAASSTAGRTRSGEAEGLADELSKAVQVPVVEVREAPETDAGLGRLQDDAHLAGARIRMFDSGYLYQQCTTAFATTHKVTGVPGILTAAHCGALTSQWVRTEISEGGLIAYDYGKMNHRLTATDGAALTTGWSYPYMYIGPYTSDQFTAISGVANFYVGQEVCSSGSYSGYACGGDVVQTDYYVGYDGTDITNAKVARIVNAAGNPMWGNGDSGGPVIDFVGTTTGLKPRAVGIISGIYWFENTNIGNCQGVPADLPNGRKCSPYGFSGSAYQTAESLNWTIQTQP
ncbi:hypothetical protein [Cellulosimicrobium protaetiae]